VFLQRLLAQMANQNWGSVFIELMVVAVGIFLGIQASNWNDDRLERQLEYGYLVRLHEDMVANTRGLESDTLFVEQQLADQAVVLATLDSCFLKAEDELAMQRGIGTLGWVNPPRLFRRTVDELASAGRMDIIRNDTIRAELADIVAEFEFRDKVMASIFRQIDHHRVRLDEQLRFDLTKPIEGSTYLVAVEFDLQALCNQPRNAAAVSAIGQLTRERLIAFKALLDDYRAFLPLVENELESRWSHTGIQ
jgi:hypothetical protein